MKSYEEIDRELEDRDANNVWGVVSLTIIFVLIFFIAHLLNRHNKLEARYSGCIEALEGYSDLTLTLKNGL